MTGVVLPRLTAAVAVAAITASYSGTLAPPTGSASTFAGTAGVTSANAGGPLSCGASLALGVDGSVSCSH